MSDLLPEQFDFAPLWEAPEERQVMVWVLVEGKLFTKALPVSHIYPDGNCLVDGAVVPWFEAKEFK